MKPLLRFSIRRFGQVLGLAVVTGGLMLAGEGTAPPPPATGEAQNEPATVHNGWPRVGDTAPAAAVATAPRNEFGAPMGQPAQGPADQAPGMRQAPPAGMPATLTLKPGTFITVRVNGYLTSARNHAGDTFMATLLKPVVVDGVLVAEQGQTLAGRVISVEKGSHFWGVSKLGITLTDLTVMDGSQIPIQSEWMSREAAGSSGRAAGTVVATTAAGAAIGAAADWGRGAAIGAGAGAAAGLVGVLLTHGHPSVIDPESVLTFRLVAPVTVSTTHAPQAFRFVQPSDYERTPVLQQPQRSLMASGGGYYAPAYDPYWDWGWGWDGFWGPGYGMYYSPGFYYGRGFGGVHGGHYRGFSGGHYGGGFHGGGFHGGGFHGGGFHGGGFHGGGGHGGRR